MIRVELKDNSFLEFESGVSLLDIAKGISDGFARSVLVASVDGKLVSLNDKLDHDAKVNFFKFEDAEGKEVFRHTSAHIFAQAVKDRKSTRLNSSHANISYAVFCLKKKKKTYIITRY